MKITGKISIILAGAILLFHSFLPHDHHYELDDDQHFEAHQTAATLLDFIKLAFHVDLGQDHLESYNVAQQEQIALDLMIIPNFDYLLGPIFITVTPAKHFPFQDKLHSRHLIKHLSLRGPPQLA